jgi:hypothetical protein
MEILGPSVTKNCRRNSCYSNVIQSDLNSTRGSRVPDFKKFSAYNRGPHSKEVDQILTSIYSESCWHGFWRANHILKLSAVSTMPQKMLTWLHDAQAVVFNLDMYGTYLNSTWNLTLRHTYNILLSQGRLTDKLYDSFLNSQDRFLKCPTNLSLISLSRFHPWGIYIFLIKPVGVDPSYSSTCMS